MEQTIDEQAVAVMGLEEVQSLIDRASRPEIPLRVFFAALDRLTHLARGKVVAVAPEAEPADLTPRETA